jgi:hypothetical protein
VIECNRTYPQSMATATPRPALEVFVNETGTITIRQDVDGGSAEEEPLVVVHPEDVSTLYLVRREPQPDSRGNAELPVIARPLAARPDSGAR